MINQRFAPIEVSSTKNLHGCSARLKRRNPFIFLVLAATLALCMSQVGCIGLTGASGTDPSAATALAVGGATGAFGSVASGSSGTQTFHVTNTGNVTLTITQLTVAGPGYSVSGIALPSTVAVGQGTTFSVKFAPTSNGLVLGTVSITANTNPAVTTVPLTGTGTGGAQPTMSVSPTSVNFGTAGIGVTLSQDVTVSNSGPATLTISNVSVGGSGFYLSGVSLPINIASGQSSHFTVSIIPPASGNLTGNLTITSNAATPSFVVGLSGTGATASQPLISVFPASVSFGTVGVGVTMSQTVTITNPSASTLTISNVAAAGLGFSVSGVSLPITIAPGQSKTFNANIAPPSTGSFTGSVTIASDSPTPNVVVGLSGTGGSTAQPAISVSPTSISFGNVNVGATGSQTMMVSNTGNATLTISNISASGTGYAVSGFALPVSIAAGQSSSFMASFAPSVAGASTGSIAIASNAPTSVTTIAVTGSGVQGQLTANPGSVAFGNVAVGTTSSQTITLTNGGSASVTVSQASVAGIGFGISGLTTPLTLAAGQTSTFTANITPTAAGSMTGTVTITSNAPNATTTISLNGIGAQPTMVLTPTSVNFGNVTVGAPNSQAILIQNTGNATLTISQATASGAGYSISGLAVPATIAAGTSKTFNIAFGPATAGAASGSVSLVSNAPGSPTSIALSGTGVATTMSLTASTNGVTFGNVAVGSSSSQSVTLTNGGNSTVTVSAVNVTGTGFSSSGVVAGQTIGAGQTGTLTIQFAPGSTATVSGNVTVTSNATNSPISISLSGTGTQAVAHSVTLSWTASTSSVVGYNVYRSMTSGGPYTLITSSAVAGTTFTDSSVQSSVTYFYVVTAVDASGNESVNSNEASVTIPTP